MTNLESKIDEISKLFDEADTDVKTYNALVGLKNTLGDDLFETLNDKGGAKPEYKAFWDNVVNKVQPYLGEGFDAEMSLTSVPFNAGPYIREVLSEKINETYGLADKNKNYIDYLKGAKALGKSIDPERFEIVNIAGQRVRGSLQGAKYYADLSRSYIDASHEEAFADDLDFQEEAKFMSLKSEGKAAKIRDFMCKEIYDLIHEYDFSEDDFYGVREELYVLGYHTWVENHEKAQNAGTKKKFQVPEFSGDEAEPEDDYSL